MPHSCIYSPGDAVCGVHNPALIGDVVGIASCVVTRGPIVLVAPRGDHPSESAFFPSDIKPAPLAEWFSNEDWPWQ